MVEFTTGSSQMPSVGGPDLRPAISDRWTGPMSARLALLVAALGLVAGCSLSGASGPTIHAAEGGIDVDHRRGGHRAHHRAGHLGHPPRRALDHRRRPLPTVTDNRVYLVGDSITESISSRYSGAVCDTLGPLGWNVTVDAYQGRHTAEAAQSLRAHRSGVGQVVVVLIGHNDAVDPESYRTQIERLIGLVPDARRVLLLTNYEFERGRDRMNDVLREIASADGEGGAKDRIELVDWNAAVEAVDGAIRSDGLHLTDDGPGGPGRHHRRGARSGTGEHRRASPASWSAPRCAVPRERARRLRLGGSGGSGGGSSGRTTTTPDRRDGTAGERATGHRCPAGHRCHHRPTHDRQGQAAADIGTPPAPPAGPPGPEPSRRPERVSRIPAQVTSAQ